MNIYPALRSQMGSWNYYVVKMSARELSEKVKYASEVYEDRTLDVAIQRTLNEGRGKKEIVEYLKRQRDRFFSSLVVAALEGDPMFYPVEITDDPQFAIFRDDRRLNEAFGVLKFDGTQKYYALDGQHRLSAIKTLLDRNNPLSDGAPEGFENDEFSVIVIVPGPQEDAIKNFMPKYHRLFSNLNRYAKPTDQATNIIMDEDDTFAILTRRLITDNDFFKSAGKQIESIRIKTQKGKNLKTGDSYFTSLETLYDMNTKLLSSQQRENNWGPIKEESTNLKTFKRFRPSEDYIDSLFDELTMYWKALIDEIPDLSKEPTQMRTHELKENEKEENESDHLLFWPIGQQMLAEIVRQLLDKRLPDPENPTLDTVKEALRGLNQLEWRLHHPPWRHFLLVRRNTSRWKNHWAMRSEDRTQVVRCGQRIQQWIIGLDELDEKDVTELQELWKSLLMYPETRLQREKTRDEMWQEIKDQKSAINA